GRNPRGNAKETPKVPSANARVIHFSKASLERLPRPTANSVIAPPSGRNVTTVSRYPSMRSLPCDYEVSNDQQRAEHDGRHVCPRKPGLQAAQTAAYQPCDDGRSVHRAVDDSVVHNPPQHSRGNDLDRLHDGFVV